MTGPSKESVKDLNKHIKGAGNAFHDIIKLSLACKIQKDATQRVALLEAMRGLTKTVLDHAGIEALDGDLPQFFLTSGPMVGEDPVRSTTKASLGRSKRPRSSEKEITRTDETCQSKSSKKIRDADLVNIKSIPGIFPTFDELAPYTNYFMREYPEMLNDRNKELLMALAHFLQNVTYKIRIYHLRNKHGNLVKPFHLRMKTVKNPFLRSMEQQRISYLIGCIAMRFAGKVHEADVLSYLFDIEIHEKKNVLSTWVEFGTEVPSWFETFYGQKPLKDEILRLLYARAQKHVDESLRDRKEAVDGAAVGVSKVDFDTIFDEEPGKGGY